MFIPDAIIPTTTAEYLSILGRDSQLAKTFKQYPSMKTTVDLFSNIASAPAAERDAAFQALQTHMKTRPIDKSLPVRFYT